MRAARGLNLRRGAGAGGGPRGGARRSVAIAYGVCARLETAPLDGQPRVGPRGTSQSGRSRGCGRAPRCRIRALRTSSSNGASTRTSWPAAASAAARPSIWRVTPPGYVHEYGETRATRMGATDPIARGGGLRVRLTPANRAPYPLHRMPARHFVKYTFLKVDPAWRRLDAAQRASDKREFAAACGDFGADHLLRAFSLVGTRGDADLMLLSQAQNLERIHEFHVVLAQSGLMKWATVPYSYLAMTKPSEYSDESRLEVRPGRGRYLFVYPFVKTRAWYAMSPQERYAAMQEHIRVGREYPEIDLNTSYSFGLDDQEFVVPSRATIPR